MNTPGIQHVAIIMDGNRRWAKAHGLPSLEGHRRGYDKVKEVADWCLARGISYLTFFAFSTENWKRSAEEVGYLMNLLEMALTKERHQFLEKGVRLRVLGRRSGLPDSVARAVEEAEKSTAHNTTLSLQLAVNYGGRAEIVDAVNAAVAAGESVTEESFRSFLYASDVPDPNMILRTSGEQRLSGFLTWQSVYSELFFVDKHWPDFLEADFDHTLTSFSARERRLGK